MTFHIIQVMHNCTNRSSNPSRSTVVNNVGPVKINVKYIINTRYENQYQSIVQDMLSFVPLFEITLKAK